MSINILFLPKCKLLPEKMESLKKAKRLVLAPPCHTTPATLGVAMNAGMFKV